MGKERNIRPTILLAQKLRQSSGMYSRPRRSRQIIPTCQEIIPKTDTYVSLMTQSIFTRGGKLGVSVSVLRRTPVVRVHGAAIGTNSLRSDAMLAYLCISSEVSHTREAIACLLWEDAPPKQSMASLRQLIRKIRLVAPELEQFITFGRSSITIDKDAITLDLDTFRNALDRCDPEILTETFDFGIEDILTKFVGISSGLDSWIAVVRNKVDSVLRNVLSNTLDRADCTAAFRDFAARTQMHFDPTNEIACEHLMRAHAEAGDQSTAIQLYNTLYQMLEDLHDTEPSNSVQNLISQIKLGTLQRNPARPERASLSDLPAIYVAQFDQDGTDNLASFTQVFRQELIINLSTFREWRLFDTEPAISDGFRLEGLAGQDAGVVHFIATLKTAQTDRIVWSQRYQIDHKNWGAVQRKVAARLSLAVNAGLSQDRLAQRTMSNPGDANLFDRWIEARSLLLAWDAHKLQRASDLLDEVLQDLPSFGPAQSSRSNIEAIRHLITPGLRRSPQSTALALDHAKEALNADPLDPRAHNAMGWALAMSAQHSRSLFHFETCRELNPCRTLSSLSCALGFAFAGETAKACDVVDETLDLVRMLPPFLWGYVQNVRFLQGDLDGAIQAGERAGGAIANLPAWHIAALWEAGERAEATRTAEAFSETAQARWGISSPFDHDTLVDWFVTCFPLRKPQHVRRLRTALRAALGTVANKTEMAGAAR